MNKKALNDIIQLTQECLVHFWQLDPEYAISHFDKNIVLDRLCSKPVY